MTTTRQLPDRSPRPTASEASLGQHYVFDLHVVAKSLLPTSIDSTLPSIIVNDRQHRDLIDDARRAVVASNPARIEKAMTVLPKTDESPPLFVRAGQVVVRVANWLRVTRDEETVSVAPPGDVPRDLPTFPPRDLPEIEGIARDYLFVVEIGP